MLGEKKVALVTGASRGIGQAIAKALAADENLTIIGTATTEAGASSISHYFAKWGLDGDGIVMDVSDPDSVSEGVAQVTSAYGPPMILVNNAGITKDGLMLRMKEQDWQQVIQTNLSSVYRTSKAVLKGMTKARWGRIINVSSVVAQMGNPGQANYCASKAGIEGFTRSLAHEIGSRGITVNAVAPGYIQTDMTEELSEDNKASMLSRIPLGRLGTAAEVASVVAYLASTQAAYVTGQTIHVNGGMYMS
ncbi:3-oxoacyl-[acyl-carrier-protein] reductase [Oleiphilus sp. HI0071]|uniref:3-oxoacyl-ACP reductase FabG n=1 Tax=unclassified Oleiphilus TaxID=2631174 RepID=UPI0007C3CCD6|nr:MULTISPECIES: 3-oxoacyl-ACP reductase FabG [unclassified Oleiphilus]KZY62338.1 3-oxoacyl-[acyl-carrier-protein] reductase [Oleiphilus sp. HI0065]KZY78908.1 3-oxoacyl-[acyl-carrier-protein] reductase [Oleiphilus sp. HI0071]KZY91810.1 3-oxoacyl-[acyl-carrier-protein] reductase [Oleiphilus sp. HI0073]KZZ39933.1 3-oxoacyl-[acyl-carrier-protein] reductase [Oleiphilus sp. HI0118]KZZ48707.1 3-oxoacyl-[acyl-carrier-protein] reductase [Oleiphilus sp. HI0122]KZZ66096.1 3-oxoacyl-[acyl-carrier-protei